MFLIIDGQEAGIFASRADLAGFAAETGLDLGAANVEIRPTPQEVKAAIRGKIADQGGDLATLLGTTSDGVALALFGLAELVAGLSKATSLAEVRAAAAPFAALSEGFLAKVESGDVRLPFMVKGVEKVVADIETRSTIVADALSGGS